MPTASNPMQQAVFRGCVECIRMLVETPPYYSVDSCCGPDGLRPIHIAAREGHIQTLRFLSASGACLQRSDFGGCTALHHAAIAGQLRAVRWLLRHGAKILLDKRGRSPIQVAADHDHMEIVSVLAKNATATNGGATLTTLSNYKDSSNPTLGNKSNNNNSNHTPNSDTTTISNNKRSTTVPASTLETCSKDSDFTTGSVDDDYSVSGQLNLNNNNKTSQNNSTNNNHNSNKPFSHLHLSSEESEEISSSKIPSSAGDCASSSGNSSLSASTCAPSLSPSASSSSAVSCGCSTSDETTLLKSIVEVSDSFTLQEYQTKPESSADNRQRNPNTNVQSPFYLHPPSSKESSPQSQLIDFGSKENLDSSSNSNSRGLNTNKKYHHKRQGSTAQNSSNSPFFLHPPENLVSETHKAVVSKMAPAPVNPSHSHHHFTDPINEPTPKLKVALPGDSSSSTSSSSSPPLSPPPQKNCFSPINNIHINRDSVSPNRINNKSQFQQQQQQQNNSNNENSSSEVKIKNQINTTCVPPPPPPPLPPPFTDSTTNNNNNHNNNFPHIFNGAKECDRNTSASANSSTTKNVAFEVENDYEDIEELTNGTNHYEVARKLLRSVSAPPPPMNNENGGLLLTNGQSTAEDNKLGPPAVPERSPVANKPPIGCGKPGVPFIPPHFPTPPQDALIKPSEYLRSIQNKPKSSGGNGVSNGGGGGSKPSSRVEEALKALGVHDNHLGLMSPVPEETNAEDEFEEVNPERINGCAKVNGHENGNFEPHYGTNGSDENNNNNNNNCNTINNNISNKTGGGGIIKAEELMKVHLRKTPMSRTKSAPPLGRVIPDDQVSDQSQSQNGILLHENGHEPLKRTNTTMPLSNNGGTGEGSTVTKAAVIAELAQSSQVGGVREWKEELRRRQKEQEKAVQKEIESYYQPVNFVSEVPSMDVTGAPIPDWKRQMMAKKAAERAKKEAEEQRRLEIEAKRMASIPMWRRQLLQRRESDGKYAQ